MKLLRPLILIFYLTGISTAFSSETYMYMAPEYLGVTSFEDVAGANVCVPEQWDADLLAGYLEGSSDEWRKWVLDNVKIIRYDHLSSVIEQYNMDNGDCSILALKSSDRAEFNELTILDSAEIPYQ